MICEEEVLMSKMEKLDPETLAELKKNAKA